MKDKNDKPKKTSAQLIEDMKNKGITFNHITEEQAICYFTDINNYLRTASYRKNYDKHSSGEAGIVGKYIDLDFIYLTELSTIDMRIREILLSMCIDIEHALKVKIITEIEKNSAEDGYKIVEEFFDKYPFIIDNIENKADAVFTNELIDNYFTLCTVFTLKANESSNSINANMCTKILLSHCPAWVLVEIISFKELILFIDFYDSKYPDRIKIDKKILNPVRSLRNACAHNNCLFNCMRPVKTKTTPPEVISQYVKAISAINNEERKKKLTCRPLFEIVCTLYAFDKIVSKNVKIHKLNELHDFVHNRMFKHIDYFENNQIILTSFNFLQKIIDFLI